MEIPELARAYAALPARDQALFAAIVRAHQVYNNSHWREELARRHARIDAGREASIHMIEALFKDLDAVSRSAQLPEPPVAPRKTPASQPR